MGYESFEKELAKFSILMGRELSDDISRSYYEELKFIPDEAWADMFAKAIEHWDSWPRNFVKQLKFFWYDWQKGNKAQVDYQDCKFCQETGVLDYRIPGERHGASCYCAHCNNYSRHVRNLEFWEVVDGRKVKRRHLRLTINEIADRGWLWDEPPPPATREDALAAYKVMMAAIDERGKKVKLAKYEQLMFDQERQPHDDDFLQKLKQ